MTSVKNNVRKNIPPTELWIGKHGELVEQVYAYLIAELGIADNLQQSELVRGRQHHAVHWVSPEKNQYRRVDLDHIFYATSFELAPDDLCFFIIEYAELLTAACANSLLKLLEEPPAGYRFILLAERKDLLLPTIVSRSLIKNFYDGAITDKTALYELFTDPTRATHAGLMRALDSEKPTEHQTEQIVDSILGYWLQQQREAVMSENLLKSRQAERMVRIITHAAERPPMPGSTKAFWRNLFLLSSI